MKFGIRTPSIKKRISARTSAKRYVRHNLGVKAPRGLGIITDPKKATYNTIYNKTTVKIDDHKNTNSLVGVFIIFLVIIGLYCVLLFSC